MREPLRVLLILASLGLPLAGCGSSGNGESTAHGGTSHGGAGTGGASTGGAGSGSAGKSGAGSSGGGAGGSAGTGSSAGGSGGGTTYVPPPSCVDMGALPAWRQGMQIGEWKELPSASLRSVTPSSEPLGGGFYGRIEAWTGFAADTVSSIIYLGGVGGHHDYAGNEMYSIDLKAESPEWIIRTQPSAASAVVENQPYYTDGRPSPAHTYYATWFVEQRQKFYRFPTTSVWGDGNGNTPHIDSWDPIEQDWEPAGTNPDFGIGAGAEAPTAKNMLTGDVYQVQADHHLWRWSAATGSVSDLGEIQGGSGDSNDLYKAPAVVDTENDRLIVARDGANPGHARIFDLGAETWSTQAFSGSAAAQLIAESEQAMLWFDSCAGEIFAKTNAGVSVYRIDPTTLEVTALPTSGDDFPDPRSGVHTLFQYLPRLGGYAYQARHDVNLYFLATQ